MEKHIALLRGDGIGPEIVDSAVKVLEAVAEKFGHTFTFTRYLIGGAAIDETGNPCRRGQLTAACRRIPCCLARSAARSGTVNLRICARKRGFSASAPPWGCTRTCARRSCIPP